MFDTQRFIFEVQNRPCIWDSKQKSFGNRVEKKQAWQEIATIFDPIWHEATGTAQQDFVEELQKKWKHIRDYYVRLKKGKGRTVPAKRTNNSYIEYLHFLDGKKEPVSSSNTNAHEDLAEEISTEDDDDPVPLHSSTEKDPGAFASESNEIHFKEEFTAHAKVPAEDADTKFLLSLLPHVRSLNERQNCEFKMEVMNLLYKIKYRNPYTYYRTGNIYKKRKRLVN